MKWSGKGASGALVRVADDRSSASVILSWNVKTLVPIPLPRKLRRVHTVIIDIFIVWMPSGQAITEP